MRNLGSIIKKHIVILSIALLIPTMSFSSTPFVNFLPMEDALSSARDVPDFVNSNIKPYRESFSLGKQKTNLFSLSNIDIFAFGLLGIVYFIIVRRNSKPRNISL